MSSPSVVGRMIELAEEMAAVAAKFERPPGNMQLLKVEYARLGELQRTVARAWKVMHDRATDPTTGDGFPPVVMDLMQELYNHQIRNAEIADQVAPLATRLEQRRIDELADPRRRRWDHSLNQDYAG